MVFSFKKASEHDKEMPQSYTQTVIPDLRSMYKKYTNLPCKILCQYQICDSKPTWGLNTRLEIEYQTCLIMSFLLAKLSLFLNTVRQVVLEDMYVWHLFYFACFEK